jgi:FkbM family methyltransferase
MLVDYVLSVILKIEHPTYLDIGAHHPTWLSNTYHFYEKGCCGVLVEADPGLADELRRVRPRDTVLNVGVGSEGGEADFYMMSAPTLNTFSRKAAEHSQSVSSHRIERVVRLPLLGVNEIVERYYSTCPNFVSIDVEGMDLEIVRTFDFNRFRPEVFCVETTTYAEDRTEQKVPEIIRWMEGKDYFVYGDTHINTVFVDRPAWGVSAADIRP